LEFNMNYIDIALEEAKKSKDLNEVPVGAVIVYKDKIIAKAHNVNNNTSVANHAEMIAIDKAIKKINDWRLNDCEMYVTLEPCPMCAGAILKSRIKKIYIGTSSNIKSNKKTIESIFNNKDYYHNVDYEYLNNKDCSRILTDFFKEKRL
jgi:tRNA(adenine34) deaminase